MREAIDLQQVHLNELLDDDGYGLHIYGSTHSEIPYYYYMKWFFGNTKRIILDDEYKQECLLGFMRDTGYVLRITKEHSHYELMPEPVLVQDWKTETQKVTRWNKILTFLRRF